MASKETQSGGGALPIFRDHPLPDEIAAVLRSSGTGAMINLPRQLIILSLQDYRPADLADFEGSARFRVAALRTVLLISVSMGSLNFDIIWSPVIARETGEPLMEPPSPTAHPAFSFVLADAAQVARGIRMATISPACATALWRGQQDLLSRETQAGGFTSEMVMQEIRALFGQFPRSVPDNVFHEICDLGD